MLIGGLEKLTLIDYPNELAAIIFTVGCNFKCPFCHNPELVNVENNQKGHMYISESDLFDFLKKRLGKLDAVVITGGEPTVHNDLPRLIKKIKKMGYLVKLDTNGTNPDMLKAMIKDKLIDYIAMDLKSDFNHYTQTVATIVDLEKIKKSINIIMNSGVQYEFRTTIMPFFINEEILRNMGAIIRGARKWYLQNFISRDKLVDENFVKEKSFTDTEMEKWKKIGSEYVGLCDIR